MNPLNTRSLTTTSDAIYDPPTLVTDTTTQRNAPGIHHSAHTVAHSTTPPAIAELNLLLTSPLTKAYDENDCTYHHQKKEGIGLGIRDFLGLRRSEKTDIPLGTCFKITGHWAVKRRCLYFQSFSHCVSCLLDLSRRSLQDEILVDALHAVGSDGYRLWREIVKDAR